MFVNCELKFEFDNTGWKYLPENIVKQVLSSDEKPFIVTILALKQGMGKLERDVPREYTKNSVYSFSDLCLGKEMFLGHIAPEDRPRTYRVPVGKILASKVRTITREDVGTIKGLELNDVGKVGCFLKVYLSKNAVLLRQHIKELMSNSVSIDGDANVAMKEGNTLLIDRFTKVYSVDFCNNGTEGISGMGVVEWMEDFRENVQNENVKYLLGLELKRLKKTDETEINNNELIFKNEISCVYASHMGAINCDEKENIAEVELIREGQWEHPDAPKGLLKISEQMMDEFISNFRAGVVGPKIPLDYNHIDDSEMTPGWIVGMTKKVVDGVKKIMAKLQITDVENLPAKKSTWTRIKEGSLQFISPSIALGWKNPADGKLYNVIRASALTNYPHIKGMDAIKPINFEEVKKYFKNEMEVKQMKLDELKKKIAEGKISLDQAVECIKSVVALEEEVSSEDFVGFCADILKSAGVKLENSNDEGTEVDNQELETVKADLEASNAKVADLEEKIKTAEALVNNSEDEKIKQIETLTATVSDLNEQITSVRESLPKENEVVVSKDDYIDYLSMKNSLNGKIQETIISRVKGNTKADIEKSFTDEHNYITSIQEMVGVSASNISGVPGKKMSGSVNVSDFVEESIASKMKKII